MEDIELNKNESKMLQEFVMAETKYIKMLAPIETACMEKCDVHHDTSLSAAHKNCLKSCAKRYHLSQKFLFNRLMKMSEDME